MALNKFFKYRNVWIGIAMLWIVFYHGGFLVMSENLLAFKTIGYGGVDICLFASGIGCYYSLEKDPDALRFLKRRVRRLGPTYLCFIIPWILWYQWTSSMPLQAMIGNLLGIQSLSSWDYHFNWYIGGLVVYYIGMPYLKKITDAQSSIWKDLLVGVLLVVASIPFWGVGHLIIILSRIPVLYAGLVFAKMAKTGYVLKKSRVLLLLLVASAGVFLLFTWKKNCPDYLWSHGLYWYPFALIVPGSCVLVAALGEKLEKFRIFRWLYKFLEIVGVYSFELYLVHVFLFECLMSGIMERLWMIPYNLLWAMTIPVIVVGSFLLNRVANFVARRMNKQKA